MKNQIVIYLLLSFVILLSFGSVCFSGDMSEQRVEALKRMYQNWTVPVEFYGQVLDQNSQPVKDAKVSIKVTYYDPAQEFFENDKTIKLLTDANGKFEISDQGRLISVEIEKSGYEYPYGVASVNFYNFGSTSDPIHDPNKVSPEIIYLHKKTYPAYLSGSGVLKDAVLQGRFDVAKDFETKFYITEGYYDAYGKLGLMPDGTTLLPYQFNSRKGNKDIQVSGSIPSASMYEIEFTPLVANSGLIVSDDRLDEAPASGYTNSVTISFPTDNIADFKKYVYAKIADGSFYSRLDIEILIGGRETGQVIVTSWTNPSGSRNLKYDREYQGYEEDWRERLHHLRKAATLHGTTQRNFLKQHDLDEVIGIKPDGTFDEALFQQEADTLKEKLKAEDPRWWHALEE